MARYIDRERPCHHLTNEERVVNLVSEHPSRFVEFLEFPELVDLLPGEGIARETDLVVGIWYRIPFLEMLKPDLKEVMP